MEWWVESLCFVISGSAICTLHSAIEEEGDLMLWIMNGPEKGTIQSSKFKVQSSK